jgi:peptidoglycan/xylan/chitin deacetylase (PgdA/CDA1 family)
VTTFIAAYDTELTACLEAVRGIVAVHEEFDLPATFFIVAGLLEQQGAAYAQLFSGHPRFEIASHTYTHMLLRDHRVCGKAGPREQFRREIVESKKRIEEVFGRTIHGFRPAVGFSDGLRGAPELLDLCAFAGYRYTSSLLWGPQESMPALLAQPFRYAAEGHAELWEVPGCGWHENLLKPRDYLNPALLQLYPHPMPEAALVRLIQTPEEEAALNRCFIDRALEAAGHVSLIWHPWSLRRFDPELKMLRLTFQYVRERGLETRTFAEYVSALPG